jgi:ATP adenylyltransferase
LERLWSPWRSKYLASTGGSLSKDICIFCEMKADPANDARNFVVYRGDRAFIVLNLYPYISGHVMVVPYEHVGELDAVTKEVTDEMMDLTKRSQTALRQIYRPDGFNIGMNLGVAAGAGIADHIHIHVMPRWAGDTNFMTSVGDTRVLPEDLSVTYEKLRTQF